MENNGSGYPSIDRPWLKYYRSEYKQYKDEGLFENLKKSSESHMDNLALAYFGKKYSFSEMISYIDRIAALFVEEGIIEGERVVILGLNTPEIICSFYAINKIGAIACMEYITQTEDKLEKIINEYHAKHVVVLDVVYEKYENAMERAGIKTIFLVNVYDSMPMPLRLVARAKAKKMVLNQSTIRLNKALKCKRKEASEYKWNTSEPAVVFSTSGTTGDPKRAEMSCGALNSLAYQAGYVDIGLDAGQTMLTPAPPFFAFGLSLTTHMPLCNGVGLILSPAPDPDAVLKQFIKYKPNLFMSSHVFLDKIINSPKVDKMDLSFAKAIELGGEGISP